MARIFVDDARGKFEVERWVDADDGSSSIMMSLATGQALNLAITAAEARQLAAALMDYADEQDAAEAAQ